MDDRDEQRAREDELIREYLLAQAMEWAEYEGAYGWVRGMPENGIALGPPAPVPDMRPRRLLRQFAGQARHQALPCDDASGDGVL